jgi:hypothetical protein
MIPKALGLAVAPEAAPLPNDIKIRAQQNPDPVNQNPSPRGRSIICRDTAGPISAGDTLMRSLEFFRGS